MSVLTWRPLVAAALVAALPAQDETPAAQKRLADNLEKKLQSEFLKKADWQTDWDKALAAAKQGDKLVFAYFTRSYAP